MSLLTNKIVNLITKTNIINKVKIIKVQFKIMKINNKIIKTRINF